MVDANVELRTATVADLHDLIELVIDEMSEGTNAATQASRIQCDWLERQGRGEILLFVAEHKGDVVGQLALRLPDKPDRFGRPERQAFADVEYICVLPAFRGGGIGCELVAHAEWHCMREDIDRIGLAIHEATQSRARAWFEALDYEQSCEPYLVEGAAPIDGQDPGASQGDTWVDLVKEF
jgi:ribosomal protein S18 acetylase RimI-like enzyme